MWLRIDKVCPSFVHMNKKRNILNLEKVKKDGVSEDRRKFLIVKQLRVQVV